MNRHRLQIVGLVLAEAGIVLHALLAVVFERAAHRIGDDAAGEAQRPVPRGQEDQPPAKGPVPEHERGLEPKRGDGLIFAVGVAIYHRGQGGPDRLHQPRIVLAKGARRDLRPHVDEAPGLVPLVPVHGG